MELTPKNTKIDIRMVVWLATIVFVLCLVCVLLRVKLESLLDDYVSRQVSQQAVLLADLSNEKFRMRLDALSMLSRKIETDNLQPDNFSERLGLQDDDSRYGLIALDGTAYAGDSVYRIADDDFRCVMESFRGKPSICYSEKMNVFLGVPVYNRHNVRFVLYRQFVNLPMTDFFDVDCFEKKCYVHIIDEEGKVLVKNNTGVWSEKPIWRNLDVEKIYGQLYNKMNKGHSASLNVEIAGETYYFYMADLNQSDLLLVGMYAGKDVSNGIDRLTFLVFWVVGLLMFLFLTALGIRFLLVRKQKDSGSKELAIGASEQNYLLESLGQEIRGPVMNILNNGAILMRENPDSTIGGYISDVQDFGRELQLLSSNLFDINKISTNSLDINAKEYDLFTLLSLSYSAANERGKSVHFELSVDPSIPSRLEGDDARLGQILSNILFNADKFIANEANLLQINYEWIQPDEDEGDFNQKINLIISVPDPSASWTSTSLTLVRMMTEALGGVIHKKTNENGIAVAQIILPQKVIKNEPIGNFATRYEEYMHASEKISGHFVLSNASILAIDEVPMNLRVMGGLIKETSAKFDAVSNGMEAIECFRSKHYDIVFLDNTMPIIDGLDILTIMKTLRNHPNENTPIIMLSADDNASAKNICESLGYVDFLTKPVHENALFAILLKYLPQELVAWYSDPDKKNSGKSNRIVHSVKETMPLKEIRESVQESAEYEPPAIEQTLPEDLRALSATGLVNVAVGLHCCERNEALYRKKLMNYRDEHYDVDLARYFKDEDFENYRILVQSMKSTSLFIGAINIASVAKSMEFACNEGDYDHVRIRHKELLDDYKRVVQMLKDLSKNGRAN